MDLHISKRLKGRLPALSSDERKQLKANIEADGRVIDPLLYWNDGKQNVVIDGMHRWEIIRNSDLPYSTEEMEFDSYEEAEIWILNHALGQRNLLKPATMRTLVGRLYNALKRADKGHGDQIAGGQIGTPPKTAAAQIAASTGVGERTAKRYGATEEASDKLTTAAKAIAEGASEADIKTLGSLSESDQKTVARAVRTGQANSIKAAIKQTGVKTSKPAKKKRTTKEKPSAAKLVDALVKKHVGQIARGLTTIAEANGGEGAQFTAADAALNTLIKALSQMRKGTR